MGGDRGAGLAHDVFHGLLVDVDDIGLVQQHQHGKAAPLRHDPAHVCEQGFLVLRVQLYHVKHKKDVRERQLFQREIRFPPVPAEFAGIGSRRVIEHDALLPFQMRQAQAHLGGSVLAHGTIVPCQAIQAQRVPLQAFRRVAAGCPGAAGIVFDGEHLGRRSPVPCGEHAPAQQGVQHRGFA